LGKKPGYNLPAEISAVSVQKKNKNRYSLFIGDSFLTGVSETTLLKLNLSKGTEITQSLLQRIRRLEGQHEVRSYLIKLLSYRAHTRKELYEKAIRKDYPKEIINNALDQIEQKGYLDEQAFAKNFAADKSSLSRWGPSKIKAHLLKKGVGKDNIEKAINEAFKEIDYKKTFLNLVLKRKSRFLKEKDLYKRKKKIFDYLKRKGFKPENIFSHIDELMKSIANE